MYAIVLFALQLFLVRSALGDEYGSYDDLQEALDYYRKGKAMHPLDRTFFPSLENYQTGAVHVSEAAYPWMARVVHSRSQDYPFMCTAVCIAEGIFVTAARCIFILKLNYTRIMYGDKRFPVKAFVVPSEPSKQSFDDIGFIVVDPMGHTGTWNAIELVDYKRTDDEFQWFEDLDLAKGGVQHTAVGYAVKKFIHRVRSPETEYQLNTLDVVVGRNMCAEIFTLKLIQAFRVPCYHSCTLQENKVNAPTCKKYLGSEGGAVIDVKTNKLLGIATWGAYFHKFELPVGFAVPNSENFYKDYECAKKIRDNPPEATAEGFYQSLCEALEQ